MSKVSKGSCAAKTHKKLELFSENINYQYLVLIALIVIVTVVMSIRSRYFLTANNLRVMIDTFIMEAIMALGMTMVIISGGIDLTIAGIVPFSSIVLAILLMNKIPFAVSAILVLAIATLIGTLTNFLRKNLRLHPMVVTMALAAVIKGVNLTITGGSAISDLPESFRQMSTMKILGIPLSWMIYLILAMVFLYCSKNSRFFIQIYFVGGNEDAARLSGIKVEKIYRYVYIMSAVLAAVAGILTAITYSSASYSYGTNADTRVIATVAIGGTSLTHGGYGSITGTLLGTLFMAIIYNAFVMSGISTYYQDVVTGLFLIAAVLISEGIKYITQKNS